MKYLFLDDDENRIKLYKEYFEKNSLQDDSLYVTTTAKETIFALENFGPFEIVHLDHDLGGEVYVTKTEETGYEVALHIEQMPEEKLPKTIVIHSFNPQGVKRMYDAIKTRNVYIHCIPFNLKQ